MSWQVWFQNRRAKQRREEKTKARPGRREKREVSKVDLTSTLRGAASKRAPVGSALAPHAPNPKPSFSIDNILARKNPTPGNKSIDDEPIAQRNQNFSIANLLKKTTGDLAEYGMKESMCVGPTRLPEQTPQHILAAGGGFWVMDASGSRDATRTADNAAATCACRECLEQRLSDSYEMNTREAAVPETREMIQDLRTSSILSLRNKAEAHVRNLRYFPQDYSGFGPWVKPGIVMFDVSIMVMQKLFRNWLFYTTAIESFVRNTSWQRAQAAPQTSTADIQL